MQRFHCTFAGLVCDFSVFSKMYPSDHRRCYLTSHFDLEFEGLERKPWTETFRSYTSFHFVGHCCIAWKSDLLHSVQKLHCKLTRLVEVDGKKQSTATQAGTFFLCAACRHSIFCLPEGRLLRCNLLRNPRDSNLPPGFEVRSICKTFCHRLFEKTGVSMMAYINPENWRMWDSQNFRKSKNIIRRKYSW